jgi:tetratricopeptide (TPR) repeat protein
MKVRKGTRAIAATAATCLVLGCQVQATAQVPGVPSTGAYPSYAPASTSSDPTVLSGRVKHDIMPAEKLLSQGKYSDAEGMFRELIVNNPADMAATIGLGTALAKQFKLDGADELFDRVLATDPNNALAYAGKAPLAVFIWHYKSK